MTYATSINDTYRRLCLIILAVLACFMTAYADKPDHGPEADVISRDSITVSLIINSPGSIIYELEGHAMLRLRKGDMDIAINYGVFDFNSPNFIGRFVAGQTDYIAAAYPFEYSLRSYGDDGRRMTEYTLNLTQDEASRFAELLRVNIMPENRTYRYNYVKDNCATRPLVMTERAVNGTISFPESPESYVPASFRDAMRHHHANYPWYQFGIDLALGGGIDYPISNREMAFSPVLLEEMLPEATITDSNGSIRPLIKSSRTLQEGRPDGGPADPTPWYLTPLAIAILLLTATLLIAMRDIRRKKVTRWWDALIFTLQGIGGVVIAYLVFISVHEATSPNWLLLWLNPLCLIVPICIYIKKCKGLVFCYEIVNFVALIILSVVWPFVNQSGNLAFIPLILADALLSGRYIYIHLCEKKQTTI